jgi:hypothetical protein
MPYTVIPGPGADDALAWIWLFASDRQAVSSASNKIDTILRRAPLAYGAVHGKNRSLTVRPLTVLYRVSEPDRIVTVLDYMYHG